MLLTVVEVAERLKVSGSFVYRLIASGQLTFVRVGNGQGRVRIDESDLQVYIDSRRVVDHGCSCLQSDVRVPLENLWLPGSTKK